MRWSGRIRMGHFPLPLSEAQRIRKFLLFPDRPSSALDPCVGDGRAFEAITNGAEVLRYPKLTGGTFRAMEPITDIATYLRLCCRPHKRKYVGISLMLACFIKCLPFSLLPAVMAT